MAQRNIFGEHDPEYRPNISEWMRRLKGADSREKQRIVLLDHPSTSAFLHDALVLTVYDAMRARFLKWLISLGSIESICRPSRPSKEDKGETAARKPYRTTPRWYDKYFKTDHVQALRRSAFVHYGGCVLCGSLQDLRLHHRHYNSLGNEQVRDLSVLCDEHHGQSHRMLGLKVPRSCPDGVRRIFAKEGMDCAIP